MIADVHFIRPDWLWAMIPIFLIILFLWKSQKKNTAWENVCDKHLLDRLLIFTAKKNRAFPFNFTRHQLVYGYYRPCRSKLF